MSTIGKNQGHPGWLADSVRWLLNVRLFALGTPTWSGESLPVVKHVSAGETPECKHDEGVSVYRDRTSNVRKMIVDLLLTDSQGLGQFSGTHLSVT